MKKILLLVFVFFLSETSVMGQTLVINDKEGGTVELGLDKLRKITFKNGNLVATYQDGSTNSYVLSAIDKMNFANLTGVETVEVMEGHLAYSAESGIAVVANSEGSKLSVYNLSGKVVFQKTIGSQIETIDLGELQKGLYLLRLDSKTIKIVR
jgi:DNA-binding beta-propeller fold protein YncE